MLDAQEFARRLRAAMDLRDPPMAQVYLAEKLGVSKQVVYEWRTTGRIGKGRLVALAEATGMPLEYYLEPERGSSPSTRAIWRKLSRAFAKVASILLAFTLFYSVPQEVEAKAFNIIAYTVHIASKLLKWLAFVNLASRVYHGIRQNA
jgi:transcriptional regulator with XRE-family HTH domain